MPSPFLTLPPSAWVAANDLCFAFRDRYPVSPGHTLVVTRRVVPDFFACTDAERAALLALIEAVKADLDVSHKPDGYNVGFNAGEAAGQTVPHVHVHVIPRYVGDMEDPRGGVRHVIPERGNYLRSVVPPLPAPERAEPLTDGVGDRSLYRALTPLLQHATHVDLLAAFVNQSGIDVIAHAVEAALARGTTLRVLTGDYLDITQHTALQRLLDWQERVTAAHDDTEHALAGGLEARIVETATLGRAFHPKSWRLIGADFGVAFVGSSNLSKSALVSGVEWNLRVERGRDAHAFDRITASFEALWSAARVLDATWLAAYAARAAAAPMPPPLAEIDPADDLPTPTPNPIQAEALAALATSRTAGRDRALVVMATGLGKTLLAAFDLRQIADELGRTPTVLWLAHRSELLEQASASVRRLFPDARFAWWFGGHRPDDAHAMLFASVQSVSRADALRAIDPHRYDVVVVDEAHHVHAASYRRVLAHLRPMFTLGLTATPDRGDAGDVFGLFGDHVPFRADLGVGIEQSLLVPFAYFGLKDTIDYAPIPWRNKSFDPATLAAAAQTEARMARLWEAWNDADKPGTRTLVFCVSIAHGHFVAEWLRERGVRVALVHSGPEADDRATALADLEAGRLDAVCSVDLFNEGVDCKPIDRVVMLRPTESPVLFLQQLGRGLRTADGKSKLTVIDFVGNHRVFLDRVRTLITLRDPAASVGDFLRTTTATLPEGCSVDLELTAIDMLAKLLPQGTRDGFKRLYRELRASRGERPRAGEMVRAGFADLGKGAGGNWFDFVAAERDLDPAEAQAFAAARDWLHELQTTRVDKSFKLVTLEVLLARDALFDGVDVPTLAAEAHRVLMGAPELFADLEDVKAVPNPRAPDPQMWQRYWQTNPIAAWTGGRWFRVVDGTFRFTGEVPEHARDAVLAMTRELLDARLAQYRRRREVTVGKDGAAQFDVKVITNGHDPILKLPDGPARDALPRGEIDVRVGADGAPWRFRFVKIAINVAHPVGKNTNALPDWLRAQFGLAAGQPGTDFRVRFRHTPHGWWAEPLGEVVSLDAARARFRAYPTLRAAAGPDGTDHLPDAESVLLPGTPTESRFAVRVSGDSMDGGAHPLRDGDWVILELCRGVGLDAVADRVALVEIHHPDDTRTHHLKRIVRRDGAWSLASDNPDVAALPATDAIPIARLVDVVRPDALGPAPWTDLADGDTSGVPDLTEPPGPGATRRDGHLFLRVGPDALVAPDRVAFAVPDRRPGETAYVLAQRDAGAPWTWFGVGRWRDDEGRWAVEAPTRATWRRWKDGRSASRTLEARWRTAAESLCTQLATRAGEVVQTSESGAWRIVGRAAHGGLSLVALNGGGKPRVVSLVDLGWVLAAKAEADRLGVAVDEARVNRLRYLDGTPYESTRWIATKTGIVLAGLG